MRHPLSLPLPLLIFAAVVSFIVACPTVGLMTKEAALFGPAQLAWPAVKDDLHRGLFHGVSIGSLDRDAADAHFESGDQVEAAIFASDRAALRLAPWGKIAPWASVGINAKLAAGEIGPGVAESLREQLENFNFVIAQLQAP